MFTSVAVNNGVNCCKIRRNFNKNLMFFYELLLLVFLINDITDN